MKNQLPVTLGGLAVLAGVVSVGAQDSSPLFKVGSVEVRPRLAYSLTYDDNIFLDHKDKNVVGRGAPGRDHDFLHTITPGLRLNAGDVAVRQSAYFDANYQVGFQRFMDNTSANAYNQDASVILGGKLNRLSLSAKQMFVSASDADIPNLAANGRVKRNFWTTEAEAKYEVSEKTTTSLELAQIISDYKTPLVDAADRSAAVWCDYQVLPKVKAGFGGTVGYLQVDGSALNHNPNSAYYRGQLRMEWQATEKVSIKARGGYEYRNVQDASAKDPSDLVFGVDATWNAAERTKVSIGANRGRVASNAVGAALNNTTSFTLAVRQGLLSNFEFAVEGGYSLSEYNLSTPNVTAATLAQIRDDTYYFVKPTLAYKFAQRAQASVFYQYRRNSSTAAALANDFYGNQLGVELSYRF